jgi:hypothetical protein
VDAVSATKKCSRRECENTIVQQGRHCSRGRSSFLHEPELCSACKDIYCPACCGNLTMTQIVIEKTKPGMPCHKEEIPSNCDRCGRTGRLTERQIAQRAALEKRSDHDGGCDRCAKRVQVAWEDYEIFIRDERIGDGSRRVYAPIDLCPEGARINDELLALGAVIEDGGQWGWDGCDWDGEPLEWLKPGYREVVTWRREVDEAERQEMRND